MHIHLPKPLHGWREFLGEVGIIVIGVLIALTAEQVLETWHWREVVEAQRKALHEEIRQALWEAQARRLQGPCMERRLTEIREVLRRHAHGMPLNLVGRVGAPDNPSGSLAAWDAAVSSQALEHIPVKEKLDFSEFFTGMRTYQDLKAQEARVWDRLASLDDAAILSPQDWSALMQNYLDARGYANRMPAFTTWVLESAMGEPGPKVQLQEVQLRQSAKDLCRPLMGDGRRTAPSPARTF